MCIRTFIDGSLRKNRYNLNAAPYGRTNGLRRKISEWLKRLQASKNTKHRRILFMEKPRARERNSSDLELQQTISINILFRENASLRKSFDLLHHHILIYRAISFFNIVVLLKKYFGRDA